MSQPSATVLDPDGTEPDLWPEIETDPGAIQALRPLPLIDVGCEGKLTPTQRAHYFACIDWGNSNGFAYDGSLRGKYLRFSRERASLVDVIWVALRPGRPQQIQLKLHAPLPQLDYDSRPIELSRHQIAESKLILHLQTHLMQTKKLSVQMGEGMVTVDLAIWHLAGVFEEAVSHYNRLHREFFLNASCNRCRKMKCTC